MGYRPCIGTVHHTRTRNSVQSLGILFSLENFTYELQPIWSITACNPMHGLLTGPGGDLGCATGRQKPEPKLGSLCYRTFRDRVVVLGLFQRLRSRRAWWRALRLHICSHFPTSTYTALNRPGKLTLTCAAAPFWSCSVLLKGTSYGLCFGRRTGEQGHHCTGTNHNQKRH